MFFFEENTVTGVSCLELVEIWLFPQLHEDSDDFIFQQAEPYNNAQQHRTIREWWTTSMLNPREHGTPRYCPTVCIFFTLLPRCPDITTQLPLIGIYERPCFHLIVSLPYRQTQTQDISNSSFNWRCYFEKSVGWIYLLFWCCSCMWRTQRGSVITLQKLYDFMSTFYFVSLLWYVLINEYDYLKSGHSLWNTYII